MIFLTRYMQKPMHIFGGIGIMIFSVGAIINIYLSILKLMGQDIWGKPMLILGLLLVVGGIQLITIGIISEIQMRTYYESQQKTPFKIKKIISNKTK